MNELQMIGLAISALVVIVGFLTPLGKTLVNATLNFKETMNKFELMIQKLSDLLDMQKAELLTQGKRIAEHGKEIDDLKEQVAEIKAKVHIFHPESK